MINTTVNARVSHAQLQAACLSEAAAAFATSRLLGWLPADSLSRRLVPPATRFAERLMAFDAAIRTDGLANAAAQVLTDWRAKLVVAGDHRLPCAGPLVLAANHPGLIDAAALLSRLAGHDVRILAARRPMLAALPALTRHLIFLDPDQSSMLSALRAARAHLKAGGTLVLFPAGQIEPDPVRYPEAARRRLAVWSRSAAVLSHGVPDARLLPVALHSVIAATAYRQLLVRSTREPSRRDWLAATCQALRPDRFTITPSLIFGAPIDAVTSPIRHAALIDAMTTLYDEHAPSARA